MKAKRPVEVFAPCVFIKEEIEARGWTPAGLVVVMQSDTETVGKLLSGELTITLGIAEKLGKAFGTSWQLWCNLEKAYKELREKLDANY